MATSELQIAIQHAEKLSPKQQLELIKVLAEKLSHKNIPDKPKYLVYGEFRNHPGKMSTEEDFKIAEWHPTEAELSGD